MLAAVADGPGLKDTDFEKCSVFTEWRSSPKGPIARPAAEGAGRIGHRCLKHSFPELLRVRGAFVLAERTRRLSDRAGTVPQNTVFGDCSERMGAGAARKDPLGSRESIDSGGSF